MTPKIPLTPRQQEIFDLVRRTIERTGSPPTRAEIAQTLGFKSANAAEEHLKALARKGVIELVSGTSRGIRLQAETLRAMRKGSAAGHQVELPMPGLAQLLLPLVGRVAAGNPILAEQHVEQQLAVSPELFSQTPDFLLRVKGMSMKDAGILDGDLLAVRKVAEARNGQIVVARLGDEVTVKRWRRDATGAWLLPENPDFQPIRVSDSEPFAIEGLAVGLLRSGLH
ncbi:transcriptional repressor LexA [Inhella gelatinilytica]|uniref:LexA repressor n=1 Tax=Inhella gelatinilytica TaxID=2795030 RepID=A0A931J033_9BURK|nr:transcriptional repressor LexA [Inhella gelatinilytica]MBH9552946.1 transcriptional repressor LexA [Inhella gelatinilytica]